MERNYNETHSAILLSAKENFLKKGYERSNLREICVGANVTTGAFYRHFTDKQAVFEELVKPVINELKMKYTESENKFYDLLNTEDIDLLWNINDDSVSYFLDFIYRNFNEFKLLLCHSDGTIYENFIHDIAEVETVHTVQFMNSLKEKGYKVKDISKEEVHMLIQACFTSIFEIIIHNYNREEAKKFISTIVEFNTIGWKNIFGI